MDILGVVVSSVTAQVQMLCSELSVLLKQSPPVRKGPVQSLQNFHFFRDLTPCRVVSQLAPVVLRLPVCCFDQLVSLAAELPANQVSQTRLHLAKSNIT